MDVSLLILTVLYLRIISCASVSQEEIVCFREGLLENLGRFHAIKSALLVPSLATKEFNKFPVGILFEALNFVDFASLIEFSVACKDCKELIEFHVKNRLSAFNPHYLFEGKRINWFTFKILSDSFMINLNLLNRKGEIIDRLELEILKYLSSKMSENESLKMIIRLSVLSFISETVHGIDSYIPSSMKVWRLNFIRRCQSYLMPATLNHLKDLNENNFKVIMKEDYKIWIPFLEFQSQNPSLSEQESFMIKALRNQPQQYSNYHYMTGVLQPLSEDFEIIFDENSMKNRMPFTEIQTEFAFNSIDWTPENINRVHQEILSAATSLKPPMSRLFYLKFPHLFQNSHNDPLLYIFTRNSLNLLVVDCHHSREELIRAFRSADFIIPNLVQMDIKHKLGL